MVFGQELVSVTALGSKTKQEIINAFALPFARYGAKLYKVRYASPDAKGKKDTLSGLMVVPDDIKWEFPRVIYQHGTSACKTCVPSRIGSPGGDEGMVGLPLASMGFVAMLPDYVGMGDGRGFQTYVHAATIASASRNMITACESWAKSSGVTLNDQLFITGYSQGGYASMALHKSYEENPVSHFKVTAACHLSGPYSLSGVMRDLILSDKEYGYPAYIPNTILGFNEAYGTLYKDLSDIFKAEYVGEIQKYYQGSSNLGQLNVNLTQLLKTNAGSAVGSKMIKDNVLNDVKTNLNHPLNTVLKENDLFRWAPKSPTRIFYCMADDQVPFMNSIVARDTMLAKGAQNLVVQDVGPGLDHGGCVNPAYAQTIFFFLTFQKLISGTETITNRVKLSIYPNPVSDILHVSGFEGDASIFLCAEDGKVLSTQNVQHNTTQMDIDLSDYQCGRYYLIVQDNKKSIQAYPIVKW
jgi:S-formylglutathione hydrolase FrmB